MRLYSSRVSNPDQRHVVASLVLILSVVLLQPRLTEAQPVKTVPDFFGENGLAYGEMTVLKNGLARSLIYDLREVVVVPNDSDLKAFQFKKQRGIELISLYRKAAPAVVVILAGGTMGSGFLINKDGWLLTNHHVAEQGSMREDLSREVRVIFGQFVDQGSMKPTTTRYLAAVYKWDKARDLALLKLKEMPAADPGTEVPMIKIAEKNVSPGEDVAAIGNAGVTLLWSLKPGVVQAVGRKVFDLAAVFQAWESRPDSALKTFSGSLAELEKEVSSELQSLGNVLVIQATCPILQGDSGGPLLDLAQGRAVGITSYFRPAPGGASHFFIHANEIREFLKDLPSGPMQALPSFWEADARNCRVLDLDANGHWETIVIGQPVLTPAGIRTNVVIGLGWDLAELSDLGSFTRNTPTGPNLDTEAVFRNKAMRLQVYTVLNKNTQVMAYDLNNDGYFELVRLGLDSSNLSESELVSEGPGKPYELRKLTGRQSVVLPPNRIPESWRGRYEKVVLGTSKAKPAD